MRSCAWEVLIMILLEDQGMAHRGKPDCSSQTRVAVYRGPAACDGCPESAATLFRSAWEHTHITYVGPDEDTDISSDSLKNFDVYIHPGGGSLEPAWKHMKKYKKPIQDFVADGGRYMGFCLGAYLAGEDPGFGLLPKGADTDEEITQKHAQVTDERDTVIQVNWTFSSGEEMGETEDGRWLYFQDGACIVGRTSGHGSKGKVLGRYTRSGDVAAYLSSYGKGTVGVVGPHPEATKDWYEEEHIKNPTGYDLDIGRDFVRAVMEWKPSE